MPGTDVGLLTTHGGARLSTCLIRSGTLVCMDAAGTVKHGDLLVEDGRIVAIDDAANATADATIDASGCLVVPGFIHGHVHLCQTLFRGLAEQADLLEWLRQSIWPMEAAHTTDSIAASARLGLMQMIAGGVTCVNDMGSVHHTAAIGEVLYQSGIRATFGKALMDQGEGVPAGLMDTTEHAIEESIELIERFHGAAEGRLRVSLAPRFILSCSETLWGEVSRLSEGRGLIVHTHLAESPSEGEAVHASVKTTAARYFARHELLGPRFVAAHGVWLDDEELDALATSDAALVHCPSANFKLGSGLANVRAWKDAGIRCGLGADGAPCNNRLDTFHEMSLAAKVSRVSVPRQHLSDREVVALATIEGARALGVAHETGSLEVGKAADIAVVDANALHHAPNAGRDPYTTLVHAAHASDVRMTMVAGRILYREGVFTTLHAVDVKQQAEREAEALRERVAEAAS